MGIFYFAMTDDVVRLAPVVQSEGIVPRFTAENAPTMEEWRRARTRAYGLTQLVKNEREMGIEEEIINGVVVRHYN